MQATTAAAAMPISGPRPGLLPEPLPAEPGAVLYPAEPGAVLYPAEPGAVLKPAAAGGVSAIAEDRRDLIAQDLDVVTERRIDSIEPVDAAEVVLERAIHVGLAQAERDDGLAGADGERHLVRDLVGAVGFLREHKDEDRGPLDSSIDRGSPLIAGPDVARRVPAADIVLLHVGNDRVGHFFVFRGIADKNVMISLVLCHGGCPHFETKGQILCLSKAVITELILIV